MQKSNNNVQLGVHTKRDHQCTAAQEGHWIVFRCPHCEDYERKVHTKTGVMKTKGSNSIKHYGHYINPVFDNISCHPN